VDSTTRMGFRATGTTFPIPCCVRRWAIWFTGRRYVGASRLLPGPDCQVKPCFGPAPRWSFPHRPWPRPPCRPDAGSGTNRSSHPPTRSGRWSPCWLPRFRPDGL